MVGPWCAGYIRVGGIESVVGLLEQGVWVYWVLAFRPGFTGGGTEVKV